jgi:hypothetical protein
LGGGGLEANGIMDLRLGGGRLEAERVGLVVGRRWAAG